MNRPRFRVTIDQRHDKQRIRITIGTTYRVLPISDARHIADRIHDLCDRIEVNARAVQRGDVP